MQKIFYVSRNEDKAHDGKAPDMDRFQRVEKLNSLIAAGWAIKEMKSENNSGIKPYPANNADTKSRQQVRQVFQQTYRTVAPPSCFYVQINFAKTFYGYCISERNIV